VFIRIVTYQPFAVQIINGLAMVRGLGGGTKQGNRIWNVLKGHGFSRADFRANIAGFSRRGMY
jgi:hypothetical protein